MKLKYAIKQIFQSKLVTSLFVAGFLFCIAYIYFIDLNYDGAVRFEDLGNFFKMCGSDSRAALCYLPLFRRSFFLYFAIVFLLAFLSVHNIVKSNIGELIYDYRKSGHQYEMVALILINLLAAFSFFVISCIFMCFKPGFDLRYMWMLFTLHITTYLLPGMYAIFIGMAIGCIRVIIVKYILSALFIFAYSPSFLSNEELVPVSEFDPNYLFSYRPLLANFFDIFNLNILDGIIYRVYDYSVYRIIAYIACAIAIYGIVFKKRRGIIVAAVAVMLFGMIGYCLPDSRPVNNYYGISTENLTADAERYLNSVEYTDGGYKITSYDMDLYFEKMFKAKVKMNLDNTALNEYKMMLYMGLKIDSVTNASGDKLSYDRNFDYITIHAKGDMSSVTIKYHGYLDEFVARKDEVFLPLEFAYYPVSGHKKMLYYHDPTVADGGMTYKNNEYTSDYHVKIHSGYNPYSNLEKTGDNEYRGTAHGPMFIGGLYHEKEVDGYKFIIEDYPRYDVDSAAREYLETIKKLDSMYDLGLSKDKYIILKYDGLRGVIGCGGGRTIDKIYFFGYDCMYITTGKSYEKGMNTLKKMEGVLDKYAEYYTTKVYDRWQKDPEGD